MRDCAPSSRVEVADIDVGRGNTLRILDWGGPGRPVVLLHPNGFCGGLYEPIAELLVPRARPIAIDLRGHGGSSAPSDPSEYRFATMAADVLHVLERLQLGRVAAVGGSLGGAVAIVADRLDPGRWSRLLLAEPVAFPPVTFSRSTENPMAAVARRRRPTFSSLEEMRATYSHKPPMSELAPEALDSYLRWGTRPDRDGVRLACDPEVEAMIFEISATAHGAADAWEHLPALAAPTTIVTGSETFLPDLFGEQAARADAEVLTVPGGHFALHEDTQRGLDLIVHHAL
jgi:pimeloyl-ACP methyl ester carboxylesterase